jgi:hypothetical protein
MIIGLTGYAGSGKSTAAKILVERHGFTLVKFAGPLKQMMRCLGLGDREIEGDLKETPHDVLCGKTPRYAMQTIGTEWGRDLIGTELWVNVAMEAAWRVRGAGAEVVIDDCRFLNEAKAVQTEGGIIVEVMRPGVGPQSGHASENQIPDPDRLIVNSGTIEDMAKQVAMLLRGERL